MNMIPSNSRRPVYYEQFGPSAVRDVARPTRRQTIMPSYSQQSTPQLGRQQQFSRPPAPAMPHVLIPRRVEQGVITGVAPDRVQNRMQSGMSGFLTGMSDKARQQQEEQAQVEAYGALIDQNSANQRDVQDMRRVIGGVPGAQTPQGYAAPLSNNGSQVADYTGGMGAFRTDEQRRADRDMANQAMRWQANREADMMSGDLRQRMQRAYGGGDIPVGPPQVRTDGTVMVGNRFMEVPSNMIPVNNSMASYQQQEGGYSERVQQRAKERLVAQGFKTDEEQDQEMARRRASYMDDVNGNSERSRQMRRAERMGLIPRGTATPVRGRAESGNMIPSTRQSRDKLSQSSEPRIASGPLPGMSGERSSDIVRVIDEIENPDSTTVSDALKNSEISIPEARDAAVDAAIAAGSPRPHGHDPVEYEKAADAQKRASDAILKTLSKGEQEKAKKEIEKEIKRRQTIAGWGPWGPEATSTLPSQSGWGPWGPES